MNSGHEGNSDYMEHSEEARSLAGIGVRLLSRKIKIPRPKRGTLTRESTQTRMKYWKGLNVKNAFLSPGPSPRAAPVESRTNKLQPSGDIRSRGRRAPQSSPSPAHPGERHLLSEGGGKKKGSFSGQHSP